MTTAPPWPNGNVAGRWHQLGRAWARDNPEAALAALHASASPWDGLLTITIWRDVLATRGGTEESPGAGEAYTGTLAEHVALRSAWAPAVAEKGQTATIAHGSSATGGSTDTEALTHTAILLDGGDHDDDRDGAGWRRSGELLDAAGIANIGQRRPAAGRYHREVPIVTVAYTPGGGDKPAWRRMLGWALGVLSELTYPGDDARCLDPLVDRLLCQMHAYTRRAADDPTPETFLGTGDRALDLSTFLAETAFPSERMHAEIMEDAAPAPLAGAITVPLAERVRLATEYLEHKPIADDTREHGGTYTLLVARDVTKGFALPVDIAHEIMAPWAARCMPPWTDRELRHKLADAAKSPKVADGYKLDTEALLRGIERAAQRNRSAQADPATWKSLTDRALHLGNQGVQLPTKFDTLNRATRGGPRAGRTVVVGGAPGASKTTWVTQLAHDYALDGHHVAILAADEDADGLLVRIGQLSGISREQLEVGRADTRADLVERLKALRSLILVDADEEGATVEDVAAELARRSEGRPSVLVVDSIQTVGVAGIEEADGPRARIDLVMATLKRVAKQHGQLVIATCELARGAYRSSNAAERTDDLAAFKESGGIEYGAAIALVLRSVKDVGGLVDVTIPKNRMGQKLPFRLLMDFGRAALREVPLPAEGKGPAPLVDEFKRKIVHLLASSTAIVSKNEICRRLGGKKATVLDALVELMDEGDVEVIDRVFRLRAGLKLLPKSSLNGVVPGGSQRFREPLGTVPEPENDGNRS